MNSRLFDAYFEYSLDGVWRGILDPSLDVALLEGKTVKEHMINVLRTAGRLPESWDQDETEPARQSA